MDAWQRHTHLAVQRVLEAAGMGVTPTAGAAPCCGALHAHAGLEPDAAAIARRGHCPPLRRRPARARGLRRLRGGDEALRAPASGTPEAQAFAERVFDVHEWLADRLDVLLQERPAEPLELTVAVQDPCHLRHAQRSHEAVPVVLGPFVRELVTLDDDGLCCGAGGAYSMLEPELATAIRARKTAAVERSGAAVVASANPGCSLHLAAAGLDVRHPLELVAQALDSGRGG